MDARGKFGEHERSVRVARGNNREQLQLLEYVYNMAKTYSALKQVLFNFKVLTMHGKGKQR